jgi:DNA mismatch endonuclease, patch repair protein
MSAEGARWRQERPLDEAWKAPSDRSPAERRIEQDLAAGEHNARSIAITGGGSAVGSIALRLYPKSRRVRAYLRWSERGKTRERYIGEVTADDRAGNLARAWRMVAERGMTNQAGEDRTARLLSKGRAEESWASSPAVRAVMKANRGRDTRPELALRSAAHALGLRYRVSTRPLPKLRRTADLVFSRPKVAVFLDGCFWHGCPEHCRPATQNAGFWATKISANRERDQDTDRQLAESGWMTLRVWEHEDPEQAARKIAAAVRSRTGKPTLRSTEPN